MLNHEQEWHDAELDRGASPPDELDLTPHAVHIEFPEELTELFHVVRNAAAELEHQGEKSSRIAMQLLQGLAVFCAKTGCP